MDIKEKLALYKSNSRENKSTSQESNHSSLIALRDHFNADLCSPQAPYLKITRTHQIDTSVFPISESKNEFKISFLSKGMLKNDIPKENCLFFDLETTGLMGGSGTFAFLLGFGRFQDNQITVDQYFIPDFGREYYVFKELNELFEKFNYLVSYNGKSYDFPLLKTRFIMNQMPLTFVEKNHIDLLHIARRIWKDSLKTCDLISVESNILGRTRAGDIPGWLIPETYFNYIGTGVIHDIIRIIEHNYLDIISLGELLIVMDKIESAPQLITDQKALMRLAHLAFVQENREVFEQLFEILANKQNINENQLWVWKSVFQKRQSEWKEAVPIWEQLIESKEFSFFALEELAKFYEHQEKNITRALEYTERALKNIDIIIELENYNNSFFEMRQNFNYRRDRLISKIA